MAASKVIGFSVRGKTIKMSLKSIPHDNKRADVPIIPPHAENMGDFNLVEAFVKANNLI
ncbi:MAG: hypothetical protein ACF788_09425 [Novipirellula sp. JB048]